MNYTQIFFWSWYWTSKFWEARYSVYNLLYSFAAIFSVYRMFVILFFVFLCVWDCIRDVSGITQFFILNYYIEASIHWVLRETFVEPLMVKISVDFWVFILWLFLLNWSWLGLQLQACPTPDLYNQKSILCQGRLM